MAITRQDETELLTALHDGILESPPWATFLRRLCGRMRADDARFLVARPAVVNSPALEFIAPTGSGDGAAPQAHGRRLPEALRHLRPNRVYAEEDIADSPQSHAKDLPGPSRRVIRVTDDTGTSGWLEVSRRGRPFSASEAALMSQLAPHLTITLRAFVTLNGARLRDASATIALDRFRVGWIVIDRSGYVVDWNEQADRLLRPTYPQWRTREGLIRLGREVDAAVAQGTLRTIPLSAVPRIDFVLAPLANSMAAITSGAALIAYVRGGVPDTSRIGAALEDLFDVPPAEGRLASRLAGGDTIAEAALALGLTIETARNYSKRLYAKTGARGHADLVRIMLEGIGPLF